VTGLLIHVVKVFAVSEIAQIVRVRPDREVRIVMPAGIVVGDLAEYAEVVSPSFELFRPVLVGQFLISHGIGHRLFQNIFAL